MADDSAFEGYIRFRILDSIGCPGPPHDYYYYTGASKAPVAVCFDMEIANLVAHGH